MAETPSRMVALGTPAPAFRLPDPSGRMYGLGDFAKQPGLLVMFICNHCPFVKHIRAGLAQFARDYVPRGLAVVAINSNDVASYPADSPEKMAEESVQAGYIFPYLYDETQEVAKAYGAACTPDFFLFDRDRKLVYRGPSNRQPVTGADLRAAADAVLAGKPVPLDQKPSVGCNIKWKRG